MKLIGDEKMDDFDKKFNAMSRTFNMMFVFNLVFYISVILFNLFAGELSANYLVQFFTGNDLPWVQGAMIGLFFAEITVPIAIVVIILNSCGVL